MEMIQRVNEGKKLGGEGYLSMINKNNDPLFDNYLALALSIVGLEVDGEMRYPNTGRICEEFKLYDR